MSGGTATGAPCEVTVTFHGVRGSTPCAGPQHARYGGHSSCVVVESASARPIILDLGTGLRPYGASVGGVQPFEGTVLLTHLHWDHVQGLPFFQPLQHPETSVAIYGPRQDDGSLAETFAGMMRPPYFPITPDDLPGTIAWHDVGDERFGIGGATVQSCFVPHVGPTLGFRVEVDGVSIAYISDHGPACCGAPRDDSISLDVLALCDGVDLLIHDAQQTPEEFAERSHWGHCTPDYALHVARESGAQRLALFHHDPSHDDDMLDGIVRAARDEAARRGVPEVIGAAEGMVLPLGSGTREAVGPRT